MRVRSITTCALGLAAALSLANTLTAQTTDTTKLRTTRSDTRINISKGEVVAPRVDTVYVTRYDTVSNTVLRVDTVTVTAPVPVVIPKVTGPFYWGMYLGSYWPEADIDKVYTNGWGGGLVMGWEARHHPLGLRFDASMNQLGKEQFGFNAAQQGNSTSMVGQIGGDVKLNVFMTHGWNFYGIGGVNAYRYKRVALKSNDATTGVGTGNCDFVSGDDCFVNANNNNWNSAWGFNAGAGTDFHIGSQDMFLEVRGLALQKYGTRSWTLPISLGVRFF